MAEGAVARLREALRRFRTPSTPAVVRISDTQKRMVGFNAGMPYGPSTDKVIGATGAIPLRGEAPTDYQRNGTTVRVRGFEQHPVVMACVRAIVDIASAVPFQVYRKIPAKDASGFSDHITVETSQHPLQLLLDAPNPFLSAQRFRAYLMTHYTVYGNALTYLERPLSVREGAQPLPPTSLRLIHPEDLTTVYINNKGYPLWYLWRDTLGYPHTSPVEDLLHVRDLNAKGLVFGFPRAASALNDIIGDNEASQYVRQVVTNNGQPSGYALVNDETTAEEARSAEEALYEKMVSRGGRGRFLFMGGVKDVKSLAFNLRDLEFPDLRRVSREDICAAFGVDPRMVGITSASKDSGLSGTQYVEARVRLIKQTIEPLMRAVESEMNLWLAPEFGDVYVRFDPDALAALQENKDATSKRVLAEMAAGARTVEETREVLELTPAFDEDDMLAMSAGVNMTPVLVALQPVAPAATVGPDGQPIPSPIDDPASIVADTPAPKTEDPADSGTQAQQGQGANVKDLQATTGLDPNNPTVTPKITDGSKEVKQKERSALDVEQARVRALVIPPKVLVRGVKLSPEQKRTLWGVFDARATREEVAYKRQAMILFGEERSNVQRLAEHASAHDDAEAVSTFQRALKVMYKRGGVVEQRWAEQFRPLIGETFAKGGAELEQSINSGRSLAWRKGPSKKEHADTKPTVSYTFHLANPNVQEAIAGRASRLAEHVGRTTARTVTDAVELGLREGMPVRDIAELIDRLAFGASAGDRATMIARTETAGALNHGEITAAKDAELAAKEWLTQGDDRVRDSHYMCEAQGQIPMDAEFATGMQYPGDPDGDAGDVIQCRCVAPGTPVRGAFVGGTRSAYHGPMREIRTLGGRVLSVTPNHPVVTTQGTRAAGLLNVGDELLSDGRVVDAGLSAEQFDHDKTPSCIEDVFDALAIRGTSRIRQARAHDFHGDAAQGMGEVNAVAPDHVLWSQPVISGRNSRRDFSNVMTGSSEPCVPQLSLDTSIAHTFPLEPFGIASRAQDDASLSQSSGDPTASNAETDGQLLDGLSGSVATAEVTNIEIAVAGLLAPCSTQATALDTVLAEVARERGIADASLLRERVLRFAREIALDQIVEIRDYEFDGHVYDLMSESGLIIAAGIVVSNCSLLFYDTLDEGASSVASEYDD